MKILSIDTETTGLDSYKNDLLEVGIVAFDSEKPFIQSNINSLRIVLVQDNIKGNVFAINMNIDLIQEMIKVAPRFDKFADGDTEGFIECKTDTLTTWYVDLRDNNLLDTLGYHNPKSLDVLEYKLTEFLSAFKETGRFNIAGKNFSGFDKLFLEKYNCFKKSILNKSRHRVLDVGSMYVRKEDESIPDLKECLLRAGIEVEVPHTAVEDAILVIRATQIKFNAN